ncbi:sulfate permease [Ectocarpus siliculosus]|uniref:Sulfate permease n=1 Tax=Ectocarpus siliculosus TaxID=2880 RepID=D7FPW1_ECTSI|nr:sulfate permease [Ectocarpus siliculosus]|eukprot:CBJ48292.1 sulfate permease [Ectocarpus siliculosus]
MAKRLGSPLAVLNFLLPITKQLNNYTSEKMTRDVVVGCTMATLMIPQGLAFATVSGIPILYGLYIVWAPPFFYSLFGVSLHVSYGPFALVGLFISDALRIRGYQPCDGLCRHKTDETQAYLEACTIITFMVSMWYFLMAMFNLGEPLAMLLADPVISGFVTASALLVANSQLWEVRDTINWWSVTMGVGSMLVYFALRRGNAYIKDRGVAGFFVPEALTVVILSTFLSWAFDLEGTQDVAIVGTIPPGLPAPKFPRLDKLTTFAQVEDMAGVALVAALVSFIITHSIAKSLAGAQEIKATPQLLAFGVANLAGSIFSALPGSASLSRAAIIDALGARTIIHNVFTFSLMTLVLLFLSPLLKRQPGVEVIRFGASLTFANKDVFRRAVIKVVEKADAERRLAESQGRPPKVALQYVILDSSSIHDLDSSSLKTLEGLVALLVDRDPPIEMFLAPVSDPLMMQLRKSPLLCATLGRRYFLSTATAVTYALQQVAAGQLVAPASLYHKVMSSISLGNLDEGDLDDI